MRPSAAEALKAAIRRSIPIVLILIVIGILAVNVLKQVQGARYSATARVYHTNTDLASALTGIEPAFIDPERSIETALSLARAPEPYIRAARRLDETPESVRSVTTVTGTQDADVITFTAKTDVADKAVRFANGVSNAYVQWRSDIEGATIDRAISQLEARLRSSPENRPALRDELERLRVLETLSSGGAIVIEQATGASKVSPAPTRDTLLGASLGFVIALLLAGAREAFNTRIRSEADVQDALGKPVLATIQTLPKRAGLVTVGRYETRWGDTYGLLAANLMQLRGRSGPTILAITSAIAGEGKTTTASNLAVAMALRGQRVVLAEFDIRKPAVSRLFRIPPGSPGIIQVVDGTAQLDAALWTVQLNGRPGSLTLVPPTMVGNGDRADGTGSLRIVPAGGTERGARIARAPETMRLLDRLAQDADVVLLDTPPALATVEMAELSASVDAVIVVVRHGRVTRRSLLTLNRQAEGWQADIVGAVLTDSPAEEDDYYSYKT